LIYKRSRYVFCLQKFPAELKNTWEKFTGIKVCHSSTLPEGQIKIEIELEDKGYIPLVIETAVNNGAGVLAFYPQEASLSEVFSWLTVEGKSDLSS
jgi:hypothetical protein